MTIHNTPNLGLPYPDNYEFLKDVPDFVTALAQALDKGRIPAFATDAARTTGIPSPAGGELCLMTNSPKRLMMHDGTTWQQVWPYLVPSGNTAPTGTAQTGAIYVQY